MDDRPPRLVTYFSAIGDDPWHVARQETVTGRKIDPIDRLTVFDAAVRPRDQQTWPLRGVTSYGRYVHRDERSLLEARQAPLGRPEATCAALIPIAKSDAWWDLAQDERRAILEDRSRHIAIGARFLPAVARRLYHSRDLGEPFDFLTWFEYAPSDERRFDELLAALRATEEWRYVTREIDIRLRRRR